MFIDRVKYLISSSLTLSILLVVCCKLKIVQVDLSTAKIAAQALLLLSIFNKMPPHDLQNHGYFEVTIVNFI